ncbi:MAG: DUF2252 family protein [Hyphomicrobiales bacterium]|nr:DUF2252 family protein [Hyphomicrobiales bacterium]
MGFEAPHRKDARAVMLETVQNQKMARSPGCYVRGSTARFYEWLHALKRGALPEGPEIWICGDCHHGNLGPTGDEDGRVKILLRDFDQAVIGNPAHDLVRLGLSLASSARGSDLPGIVTAKMLETLVAGYEAAFEAGVERPAEPKVIRRLLKKARKASWTTFARANIEDPRPTLPLGKRFWPLTQEERRQIERLFAAPEIERLMTALRPRKETTAVKLIDAAFWRKGCSSLGRLRYAVLMGVGPGTAEDYCLMDVKEAVAPDAPHAAGRRMPREPARRVLEGARHLSPYLGDRMLPAKISGHSIFVRELLPQDLKIEIERLGENEAAEVARYLAFVVGEAHMRQLGREDGQSWLKDLRRSRSKSLDAPSWLWTSVVDLLAVHDRAYLDHCRRVATLQG